MRYGFLAFILIGQSKTGVKKKARLQNKYLALCLCEKEIFEEGSDHRFYKQLYDTARKGGAPLSMKHFCWCFSFVHDVKCHGGSIGASRLHLLRSGLSRLVLPTLSAAYKQAVRDKPGHASPACRAVL